MPDPSTLYPTPGNRRPPKSYRGVDDRLDGGTVETWSYPERGRDGVVLHRSDGPAKIERYPGGEIHREQWWVEGELHRVDGPAQVTYNESGESMRERWWVRNAISRIDGPAEIVRDDDGETVEVWWFAGRRINQGREEAVRRLRGEQTHLVHRAIDASSYRALLLEGRNYGDVMETLEAGVFTVEGMREVLGGAPLEWVRSWESGLEAEQP